MKGIGALIAISVMVLAWPVQAQIVVDEKNEEYHIALSHVDQPPYYTTSDLEEVSKYRPPEPYQMYKVIVHVFRGDYGKEITGTPPSVRIQKPMDFISEEVSPYPTQESYEVLQEPSAECPRLYPKFYIYYGGHHIKGIVFVVHGISSNGSGENIIEDCWIEGSDIEDAYQRGLSTNNPDIKVRRNVIRGFNVGVSTNYGIEMTDNIIHGNKFGMLAEDFANITGGGDVFILNKLGNIAYIPKAEPLTFSMENRYWYGLDQDKTLKDTEASAMATIVDINNPTANSLRGAQDENIDIMPVKTTYHPLFTPPLAAVTEWRMWK